MPFKLNQDRRHHIPRQQRKVTNWPAYDASLRRRGSLTVWFTEEAVEAWAAEPRTTRGGQPWYSPLAILTARAQVCGPSSHRRARRICNRTGCAPEQLQSVRFMLPSNLNSGAFRNASRVVLITPRIVSP